MIVDVKMESHPNPEGVSLLGLCHPFGIFVRSRIVVIIIPSLRDC